MVTDRLEGSLKHGGRAVTLLPEMGGPKWEGVSGREVYRTADISLFVRSLLIRLGFATLER